MMAEIGNLSRHDAGIEKNRIMTYANSIARYIDRLHKRIVETQKYMPASENDPPFDITPYLTIVFPIVRLDRMEKVKEPYPDRMSQVKKMHHYRVEKLKESSMSPAELKAQAEADISHQEAPGAMEQNVSDSLTQPNETQGDFKAFLKNFTDALRGRTPDEPTPSRPVDPQAGEDSLPGTAGNDAPENPSPTKSAPSKDKKSTKAHKKTKRKQRQKQKRKHRHK